jgi:Tfp pilus assembly protein PilF
MFADVVSRDPGQTLARYHLALAFLAQRDLSAAAAQLEEVLEREPGSLPAANNLALIYRELGRPDDAASLLRNGLQRAPDSSMLHFNLAVVLRGQGRVEGARQSFERVVELEEEGSARKARAREALGELGGGA